MFATSVLFYQISAICQVRIFQTTLKSSEKISTCVLRDPDVYCIHVQSHIALAEIGPSSAGIVPVLLGFFVVL